ncbi:MAG TPA: hypothetical protein VF546_11430 [Pyrinomonadaceae bacterium]|jgi:hypothetical protein
MSESESGNVTFEVRVAPGRAGTDPDAPDWQVCELLDGEVQDDADVYDNLTLAEANQLAAMWTRKKEEAEADAAG